MRNGWLRSINLFRLIRFFFGLWLFLLCLAMFSDPAKAVTCSPRNNPDYGPNIDEVAKAAIQLTI